MKTHHHIVLILAFFAAVMSAVISQRVFERLPHLEDEVAYLWEAKLITTGHLVIDSPEPRRAYWQPFVVDYTLPNSQTVHRFGKYSLGWPLLLAIGAALGQAWLVNACFSMVNVALVYRLGRELFSPQVGVVAAALVAFSPMALLLNATLMGHTAALCSATAFMLAYRRMASFTPSQPPPPAGAGQKRLISLFRLRLRGGLGWGSYRWPILAGILLGWTVINRPLTGLALALPFALYSLIQLLRLIFKAHPQPLSKGRDETESASPSPAVFGVTESGLGGEVLRHLLLALSTGVVLLLIPFYNTLASGNPTLNLYTLVWPYDQVGFGEGYGRSGHSFEKGWRQMRWDLSLAAADLFGWQTEPLTDADGQVRADLKNYLLVTGNYWQPIGLSWILLPFGLWLGLRRKPHSKNLTPNPSLPERGLGGEVSWTLLLAGFAIALIGLHIAYWVGSERYSTRYYFEMLPALAVLSALPIAWLAKRAGRGVYAALAGILLVSLVTYSLPRIGVLYHYNFISQDFVEAVKAHRLNDKPILLVLNGADTRWRAVGPLLAETSPLLDSPIVAAIDYGGMREAILARFPTYQVIDVIANGNRVCFVDGACYGEI